MEPNRKNLRVNRSIWEIAGLGVEFAAILFVFIYLGNYLDTDWGFKPWGLVLSLGLGFGLGLYHIVRRSTGKR
jgi:F0F1-type ATP synthase assembly protein I